MKLIISTILSIGILTNISIAGEQNYMNKIIELENNKELVIPSDYSEIFRSK